MFTQQERATIKRAMRIIRARALIKGEPLSSPTAVKQFLQLKLAGLEHETIGIVYLDAQNRFLGLQELFRGTLTESHIYPREVAKEALWRNAGAIIVYHNHPAEIDEPSAADVAASKTLKRALALIDVKLLDNLIITGRRAISLAQRGVL
jgi:DNA repair protein RadC